MKTVIWKTDIKIFKGLATFIACNKDDIVEYINFYEFIGNCNPYELDWIYI